VLVAGLFIVCETLLAPLTSQYSLSFLFFFIFLVLVVLSLSREYHTFSFPSPSAWNAHQKLGSGFPPASLLFFILFPSAKRCKHFVPPSIFSPTGFPHFDFVCPE